MTFEFAVLVFTLSDVRELWKLQVALLRTSFVISFPVLLFLCYITAPSIFLSIFVTHRAYSKSLFVTSGLILYFVSSFLAFCLSVTFCVHCEVYYE
jgi:hypothetical protein